jgi:hypothetical protein
MSIKGNNPMKLTKQQLSDYAGSKLGLTNWREPAPALHLMDDTKLSIQASRFTYCTPRTDFATQYSTVEVGFPSFDPPESWMEYCENPDEPQETVYGYIPLDLVLEYINKVGINKALFPVTFDLK